MDEFYYEESNPKNVFIKCLIILFVIGLFLGVFFYKKHTNTFKLKDVNINLGEKLSENVSDYLVGSSKYLDEYKLYLNDVDVNKVGEYTYKVKYNKHIEKGIIRVIDNKEPIVTLSEDIIVGVDEELDLDMLLTRCEDDSLPCKVSLKNEKDLNKLKKEGIYKIDVIVTDAVGNKTNVSIDVTSSSTETMSSLQMNDLKYYTNSENNDSIEHTLFISLDKAINEETLEYEGMIQELSATDFSEYVKNEKELSDVKLITVYNKYSYVIGFQVLATFTDGTSDLLEK